MAIRTVIGAISLLAWAVLLGFRGRFWRVADALPASGKMLPPKVPGRVVAVVPARNEADVVADAVVSLLKQSWGDLEVILIDDSSTDGTAEAAQRGVQTAGLNGLRVIRGKSLPSGWTGKLWAMQQGVQAAEQLAPDWLLFTDADVVHGPDTLAQLAAIAELGSYDMVSFMVKLQCETAAERLLIPAYIFFFFMLYPPRWVVDPWRNTAGAAGGCILIRPDALVRVGGLETIRSEIIDDCALARAVKRSGGRVWLGLTNDSRSTRSYGSFSGIWKMIARNAFNQLHHSAWLLSVTVIGTFVVYLAPPLLLISSATVAVALGAAAWLAMTIAYAPMVRFYRLNPLWALTLPMAALFYMGATIASAVKYWSGKGGEWKGRVQDRL